MRKTVSGILLALLLTSVLAIAVHVQPVRAGLGTVYINADGSVTPSTAPIYTADNITYTLTGNVSASDNGIVIERDNVTLDGAGYEFEAGFGRSYPTAILLDGVRNVTVANTIIPHESIGICVNCSSGSNIFGTITGSSIGVAVYSSNYTSIYGNKMTSAQGIALYSSNYTGIQGNTFTYNGLYVQDSYGNSVENNTVNGKPLEYLEGVSNQTVGDAGQVVLVSCENITVEGLNFSGTNYPLELWETNDSTVSGNDVNCKYVRFLGGVEFYGWFFGFLFGCSSGNTISGNNITESEAGILLQSCSSNVISGNNITDAFGEGLALASSSNNIISGNNITNSRLGYDGLVLTDSSSGNIISGNNITNNVEYGIDLDSSSGNNVSGNNLSANCYGVFQLSFPGNIVSGNNITNNVWGVLLMYGSDNEVVSGNTFWNDGLFIELSQGNSVENNTVNGRPLVYLEGVANCSVSDAGQVILIRCDGISVQDSNLSSAFVGAELISTTDSTVTGNNITEDKRCGIWLEGNFNDNDTISGNYIANDGEGILLIGSYNDTLRGNNIVNCEFGIDGASFSNIVGNNFTGYDSYYLFTSWDNTIYHNNFFGINWFMDVGSSSWDDPTGYPRGGNYWGNYTGTDLLSGPSQNMTGSDGIGDTPYMLDALVDHYPLIKPWNPSTPGDLNGDRKVGLDDLVLFVQAYGSKPGDPKWNPNADLDGNGRVDLVDLVTVAVHYGQNYP